MLTKKPGKPSRKRQDCNLPINTPFGGLWQQLISFFGAITMPDISSSPGDLARMGRLEAQDRLETPPPADRWLLRWYRSARRWLHKNK